MNINQLTPEQEILKELAQRLARVRKAQGYSQARLAEEAGIGVATLKRIEAGQDSQLETWIKVLKALNMVSAIDALLPENFKSPMAEVIAISSSKSKKKSSGSLRQSSPQGSPSSSSSPSSPSGVVWGDQAE